MLFWVLADSNKLGGAVAKRNEKLNKTLEVINGLQLGNYQDYNNDIFGDAYEFLPN
ncbi:MAG: hypothetical protein ACRCY6_04930 [Bacteroidales bacterium]